MKFLTTLALLLAVFAVFLQIGLTEEIEGLDDFGELLQDDNSDEQA